MILAEVELLDSVQLASRCNFPRHCRPGASKNSVLHEDSTSVRFADSSLFSSFRLPPPLRSGDRWRRSRTLPLAVRCSSLLRVLQRVFFGGHSTGKRTSQKNLIFLAKIGNALKVDRLIEKEKGDPKSGALAPAAFLRRHCCFRRSFLSYLFCLSISTRAALLQASGRQSAIRNRNAQTSPSIRSFLTAALYRTSLFPFLFPHRSKRTQIHVPRKTALFPAPPQKCVDRESRSKKN